MRISANLAPTPRGGFRTIWMANPTIASDSGTVLVASSDLVDLWTQPHGLVRASLRRRGRRGGAKASGPRRDRRGTEHRRESRPLFLVEEAEREERRGVCNPQRPPARQAGEARGGKQDLPHQHQYRRRDRDQSQPSPLVGHREEAL